MVVILFIMDYLFWIFVIQIMILIFFLTIADNFVTRHVRLCHIG